eukprot:GFUD01004310.1.p1 GENE.GFUD01004310.1~~GFUD01004310.1.p1  ORF type:complete len:216 (-),score=62.68 GFUD01004310.1:164-766(-)
MLLCLLCACLLATVHTNSVERYRRQTNFGGRGGGGSGQGGGGSGQGGGEPGQSEQPSTDTRFFFGNNGGNSNSALINGGLGFGLGAAATLLGQNLFGGSDCACVTGGRRRRQAEVETKFFLGGGNSGCNCPAPTSSAAGNDCKGRPEGDTFYGCGCSGGGGGLFGLGRRRRQTSQQGENVNTKFLDFRCIGATILGRKAT